MGVKEGEEEVHFLPFTARTWGSFLPWKEILLPHMVGSKDGSSESRHMPAQQIPPVGGIAQCLSGFRNQITLALNGSITTHIAL